MDVQGTQLIPKLDSALPELVKRKLKEKIAKGATPVRTFRGLPVYRFGDDQIGYYCLVDGDDVIYFVRFMAVKHNTLSLGRQVLVWRKPQSLAAGFAKTVFFDLLLKEFKSLVADQLQTEDGQKFWDYAITEALGRGLNVYAFDRRSVPNTLTPIRSDEDLRHYYKTLWGDDEGHKRTYAIISKVPLRLK